MIPKIEELKKLLMKKGTLTAAAVIGLAGMLMIMLSGMGESSNKSQASELSQNSSLSDSNAYRQQLEEQLEQVLSQIKGVGRADVMITLSSSEEYIYAEESTVSGDKRQTEYVIADNEGLIRGVNTPSVSGAVIVCEGGGNTQVCEKVYKAASVVLGIPTNRICVAKMK